MDGGLTMEATENETEGQPEKVEGPFYQSDELLVKQIRAWFKEASDAKAKVAEKRKKCHRFYAGEQWEEADLKIADSTKRPALTLNMILTIIGALEGEERENRTEIKFFGAGVEDDPQAAGLNRILKWINESCGGEFALSEQFRNGVIGGEGWIVPEVDYFEDPEGLIKLVHVDDEHIFDDPLSVSPVGKDARYLHRVTQMSEDELEARWPGAKEKLDQCMLEKGEISAIETDGKGYRDIYSVPGDSKSVKLYDAKSKMWSVLETWWTQIEPGVVVVNEQTGLLDEVSPAEFEAMKEARDQEQVAAMQARVAMSYKPIKQGMIPPEPAPIPPALQAIERPVKRFYQAFSCFDVLLEKTPSALPKLKRFPYVPFRVYWAKALKEWFGIVWPILDPQRQHNIEQSVIVQLMQLMPKQSWMAPKGAYHDKRMWETKLALPGALLEFNASRGKPEPIPSQAIPRHLIDMAFTRPETMRGISGVNVELTGQRQGSDAGIVMEQRRKAAKTVLAPIFDNFRQTKVELGRVLLAYIQQYITPGRIIRVLGPDRPEPVIMSREMASDRYDITIDETESSENDRLATLSVLQTTLPALAKAGMSITPAVVDLLPMSPNIRDEMKTQLAWEMTLANRLPPPGWKPGMPIPMPAPPAGPAIPPQE